MCSPGWWAVTVATYCPSRQGNYPNYYIQNLANEWPVQTGEILSGEKRHMQETILGGLGLDPDA